MKNMKKRTLSLMLVLCMVFSLLPSTALASSKFSDMPDDYSTEALQNAVINGLLSGSGDKIMPNDNLTRSQMAAILVRAFGAEKMADLTSFTDVNADAWYYEELSAAVYMGILKGDQNEIRPDSSITREEAFVVLARAFGMEALNTSAVDSYADGNEVSSWAREGVAAMIEADYVKGDGVHLNPTANISRKDFAVVMDRMVASYITDAGTYTDVAEGSVMIITPDVTLEDTTITGDLILGDGIGEGEVTLDNVTVLGDVVARGGGSNSVYVKGDSALGHIKQYKVDGDVRFVMQSSATVNTISVYDGVDTVILAGDFEALNVYSTTPVVIENGNIQTVSVSSADVSMTLNRGANIESITMTETATDTMLEVESGARVEKIVVQGQNAVIDGTGTVNQVDVNADNANIDTQGTKVVVAEGIEGTVADRKELDGGKTVITSKPSTGGGGSQPVTEVSVTTSAELLAALANKQYTTITMTADITVSTTDTEDSTENLTINEGKTLVIAKGNTLTVTGKLSNHGTLVIKENANVSYKNSYFVGQFEVYDYPAFKTLLVNLKNSDNSTMKIKGTVDAVSEDLALDQLRFTIENGGSLTTTGNVTLIKMSNQALINNRVIKAGGKLSAGNLTLENDDAGGADLIVEKGATLTVTNTLTVKEKATLTYYDGKDLKVDSTKITGDGTYKMILTEDIESLSHLGPVLYLVDYMQGDAFTLDKKLVLSSEGGNTLTIPVPNNDKERLNIGTYSGDDKTPTSVKVGHLTLDNVKVEYLTSSNNYTTSWKIAPSSTLTIENGGQLVAPKVLSSIDNHGTVTVKGAGSKLQIDHIFKNFSVVNLEDSGQMILPSAYHRNCGTITVDGHGSKLEIGTRIWNFGYQDKPTATITVKDGGALICTWEDGASIRGAHDEYDAQDYSTESSIVIEDGIFTHATAGYGLPVRTDTTPITVTYEWTFVVAESTENKWEEITPATALAKDLGENAKVNDSNPNQVDITDAITLSKDIIIPKDVTLNVNIGTILTIPESYTLTNNGTLKNQGNIHVNTAAALTTALAGSGGNQGTVEVKSNFTATENTTVPANASLSIPTGVTLTHRGDVSTGGDNDALLVSGSVRVDGTLIAPLGEVDKDATLTVSSGGQLTIGASYSPLMIYGTLDNNGTITNSGTLSLMEGATKLTNNNNATIANNGLIQIYDLAGLKFAMGATHLAINDGTIYVSKSITTDEALTIPTNANLVHGAGMIQLTVGSITLKPNAKVTLESEGNCLKAGNYQFFYDTANGDWNGLTVTTADEKKHFTNNNNDDITLSSTVD